jgi:hypothetical protein
LEPYWTRTKARTIRDATLNSRTARARLKVRHKPYYRLLESGLHLGYRKPASGPGNRLLRQYKGNGNYQLKNLAPAHDYADANGQDILSFAQAQNKARQEATKKRGPYTVAQALTAYSRALGADGREPRSIHSMKVKAAAHILPQLGDFPVSNLTATKLRDWRDALAASPPRVRTAISARQRHGTIVGEDGQRARRASANRIWSILRAALNQAFRDEMVASEAAWRRVKPFKKTDRARNRYLKIDECRRLINASSPTFRLLVEAALQTGARYSELARLIVSDFDVDVLSGSRYADRRLLILFYVCQHPAMERPISALNRI